MGRGEKEIIMPSPKTDSVIDTGEKPDPSENIEEGRDRHTEHNLDHGLKETFPASDPVSISPGAD